ncbi:MAG: PilZ domain-containing protein [Thermoanaerobaculia bacterium]
MSRDGFDRRRFQRLLFQEPLVASLGGVEVEIVDFSLHGARVVDLQPLPLGRNGNLAFQWMGERLSIPAEVVRCRIERQTRDFRKNIYTIGLRYTDPDGEGARRLKEVISDRVKRAVEEQVANARGSFIPLAERMTIFRSDRILTLRAPSGQRHTVPDAMESYLSSSMTPKGWKQIGTSDPKQPAEGFTVSALEDPAHIDLLRKTYEKADQATRLMIRILAEQSLERG